jgi:DNA-damage-inducible protein D
LSNLNAKEHKTFEGIKRINTVGVEFWFARELLSVLQYADWKNFIKVINKAMLACKNSGYEVLDHFAEVRKMVDIGSDLN